MSSMLQDDAQWLDQYVREGSEPAFRKLVERYLALVNATARRMTGGNVHLAQDITQLVFTDLARKAASLPRGVILGGWLHRHTCYTAFKALRTENRRHQREKIAMELTAINDNSSQDAHWLELAPVLDEALNRLGTRDREVIVLRYFQQLDIRSIGHDLGATETAVQKRLGRALEKLRALLTRRGVTLASTMVLGSALDAGVVASVSSGLVATVSTTAVGSASVATGFTLTSLLAMISAKKIAVGIAAMFILAGLTTASFKQNNERRPPLITSANLTPFAVMANKAASPATSTPSPKSSSVNQIEAPKLPPAPAGNLPVTPDDLAASTAANTESASVSNFLDGPSLLLTIVSANGTRTKQMSYLTVPSSGAVPDYFSTGDSAILQFGVQHDMAFQGSFEPGNTVKGINLMNIPVTINGVTRFFQVPVPVTLDITTRKPDNTASGTFKANVTMHPPSTPDGLPTFTVENPDGTTQALNAKLLNTGDSSTDSDASVNAASATANIPINANQDGSNSDKGQGDGSATGN